MSEIPQSPFAVALQLAELIAFAEKKSLKLGSMSGPTEGVDRAYILDLYKECLKAVASQGARLTPTS